MYSFDVFDTLITRTTATPEGIFALMKDRLREEKDSNGLDEYVIDNFFELRIHSEELSRKAGAGQGIEERSLRDIYEAMSLCGCLSKEQAEYLYQLEQETEIANVMAIPENIQRVKELVSQGERVILISDMYLPRDVIYKMLIKADTVFAGIPLYVSSEYGKRKTTGNLYRHVQEREQVCYEDWIHTGDNLFQDIEVPCSLGMEVRLSCRREQNRFETSLLEKYGDDSRLQLMIGAALRSEQNPSGERKTLPDRAYHVGCRYAGPLLYSYAEWLADQAIKKGIKRLYFIARDGYLIKQIVDIILAERAVDIRTCYIYGSRKAWRMPSLSEEHYNLYQLIDWSHVNRIHTLKTLADILHVPLQELYEYLPGTYAKDRENIHVCGQELEYIAEKLEQNEAFKVYHLQKLEAERRLVQKYLEQEIDTDDDRFAFVDISGGGLTQGCLQRLMSVRYKKPIRTFFFRIDRVNLMENSITNTFIPEFSENRIIVEMLCRAPHGQTRGYMQNEKKIVPVLENTESKALIEHGLYEYERGILAFSRQMCETSKISGKQIASMKNVLLYLRNIGQEPSEDVLEFFASMPSSESGREKKAVEYAPKLTEHDIKEIFLRRTYEPVETFYKGTNLNYSILRATAQDRALIERCKREHDSALGKLYRQKEEKAERELRRRYGRAAFYPVRLLEEKVILYGAGKFGQELYRRLEEDAEHEVILWVDKMARSCQQKGLTEVCDVSQICRRSDGQIVIAVMSEGVAMEIQRELEEIGIQKERMVWIQPYSYPNPQVRWKVEKIG